MHRGGIAEMCIRDRDEAAFTDVATGTLVNSGFLNGLSVVDAKKKMLTWLEETGKGRDKVNYKLRDWVFSRQRYWGCLLYTSKGSHSGVFFFFLRRRGASFPQMCIRDRSRSIRKSKPATMICPIR